MGRFLFYTRSQPLSHKNRIVNTFWLETPRRNENRRRLTGPLRILILQGDILGTVSAHKHPTPISTQRSAIAWFFHKAFQSSHSSFASLTPTSGSPPSPRDPRLAHDSFRDLRCPHTPDPLRPAVHPRPLDLALSHTDIGCITFLVSALGGLHILHPSGNPQNESGWCYICLESNCAVINIGDALVKRSGAS